MISCARLRQQRGVALLTMLLIAALASVILVNMLSRHQLAIAQARQTLFAEQGMAQALGVEAWLRHQLYHDIADADDGQQRHDGMQDAWLQADLPHEIPAAMDVELQVRDLSGLFNLNSLANDAAAVDRFRRLLDNLGLDPILAEAVRDWVTPPEQGMPDVGPYATLEPPYRTAQRAMRSITELRLLDFGPGDYERLAPFVTALPAGAQAVNVNTAPPPVLATLAPGMDPDQAGSYAFPEPAWTLPGDLLAQEAGFAPEQGVLSTRSRFVELRVEVSREAQRLRLRSVIMRDLESGETRVLSRDLGGLDSWPPLAQDIIDEVKP